jgi:hypothetical protein
MIKDWSIEQIINEISKIAWAEKDRNMPGITTWKHKQDLYQLKWFIEHKLDECNTYADEEEYVRQHEVKETFRRLSK